MSTEVKGAVLVSVSRLLERQEGPAALQSIIDALGGEFGERMRTRTVLAASWYSAEWIVVYLQTAQRVLRRDDSWALQLGRELVSQDLSSTYRLFVKMISPQMLLSWSPRLFAQYYRGGKMEVSKSADGHTVVDFTGWGGFDSSMWAAIRGGCVGALQACGAADVLNEVVTGGRGADLQVAFHWSAATK